MLEYLKSKIHRNTFFAYVTVLFLICVAVCAAVCHMIASNQVQQYKANALDAFDRVEDNLSLNIAKIDNYVLNLYSNRALEKDFLCFFSHSAQEYLTQRLEGLETAEVPEDFLASIKGFVQEHQFAVTQIALEAGNNANVIYFYESSYNTPSINVDFCVPSHSMDIYQDDVSYGYVYTKKLYRSDNIDESLGEMKFLLSSNKIFDVIKEYTAGNCAVMSKKGALYYLPSNRQDELADTFNELYQSKEATGVISRGLFYRIYYFTSTSQYGYKLISMVDTQTIFQQNAGLFLLVIIGSLLIFVVMTFLISVRMNQDAHYLNRIIDAIQMAKSGRFSNIELGGRKDEYGVIAQEFNDMSAQLEQYIRKEYVLKLKQQDAEMKALQHQINPHFLYNTLEIIRSCALVNQDEKVADAIYNLGAMYRDIVKSEAVITIDKELDILNKYLKIMEFKYSENFYYQIDIVPEVRALETVKLWMQPLVENFFVHGFDKNSEFNLLLISGRVEENRYVIELMNNGSFIEEDKLLEINSRLLEGKEPVGNNIGIQNVYHRLRHFYGETLQMKIDNNDEAGITVTVHIYKKGKD